MTKAELRNYKNIKSEKEELEKLIQEYLDSSTTMKATRLAKLSAHGGKASNPMLAAIIMQENIAAVYSRKVFDLSAAMQRIETAIAMLPSVERRLMRMRYIEGYTWAEVCERMSYSSQRVHQIHGKALLSLQTLEQIRVKHVL
jgi:RNA polymerase sigma factor (sigma-70 family)